jgi:hypothetical protein
MNEGRIDDRRREPGERWEWIEYIVPVSFLRVLWNGLFPSRFRALVLEGLDGSPPPGYARPLSFAIGCWLLLFAAGRAFPWAFKVNGVANVLSVLPAADRHEVAHRLGIDTIPGVVIPDSGEVRLGPARARVVDRVHRLTQQRFGRPTPSDIADYLEGSGDVALGIRVRGYAARMDDRPTPVDETTVIFFVVFGLVPGWWVSHLILASHRRSARETRAVHMYNDSWFVVFVLIPFSLATYAGGAFDSRAPQYALLAAAIAGLVTWIARTPGLYRATHDAARWRVALAHVAGLSVAAVMAVIFAILQMVVVTAVNRLGV